MRRAVFAQNYLKLRHLSYFLEEMIPIQVADLPAPLQVEHSADSAMECINPCNPRFVLIAGPKRAKILYIVTKEGSTLTNSAGPDEPANFSRRNRPAAIVQDLQKQP